MKKSLSIIILLTELLASLLVLGSVIIGRLFVMAYLPGMRTFVHM
jgi:hypothetical protein